MALLNLHVGLWLPFQVSLHFLILLCTTCLEQTTATSCPAWSASADSTAYYTQTLACDMDEEYLLTNSSALSVSGQTGTSTIIKSPGNCSRSFTIQNSSTLTLAYLSLEFRTDCDCSTDTDMCGNGGLVHVSEASSLVVSWVQFKFGSAIKGGCIFAEGPSSSNAAITIHASDFTECYSNGDGGSIYVAAQRSITTTSSTFKKNNAFGKGGGIYIANGATLRLSDSLNNFGDNTITADDNQANQGKQIMKAAGGVLHFNTTCPSGTETDNSLSDLNVYAMERPFTGCKTVIQITKCERGKYTTGIDTWTLERSCVNCPDGRFSDVEGLCDHTDPTEQYIDLPAGLCECTKCDAGKQSVSDPNGRTSCVDCSIGMFNDEMGIAYGNCKACQAGKYASETGVDTCSLCGKGRYSTSLRATDVSTCLACPTGYYSEEKGSTGNNCNMCAAGFYSTESGLMGQDSCSNCIAGKFRNTQNTDPVSCVECPKGRYNNEEMEDTACKLCRVGRYYDSQGADAMDDCKACGQGKYIDVEGMESESDCKLCSEGKFQSGTGKSLVTDCTDCVIGQYNNEEGKAFCLDCDRGLYQDNAGTTICKECHLGTYLNEEGATLVSDCSDCQKGKYGDETGKASCKNCVMGSYSDEIGQTSDSSCKVCPIGKHAKDHNGTAISGMTFCTDCPVGMYMADFLINIGQFCMGCSGGSNKTGETECPGCNIGEFGYSSGCQYSPITTDVPGDATCRDMEPCTPCPSGWYSGAGDKLECTMCPKGFYSNGTSSSKCDACQVGKYGTWVMMGNNRFQYEIPVNKSGTVYRENENPIAFSSIDGPALYEEWTCVACGAGMYGTVAGNSEDTYLDQGGAGGCINCPQGKWSNLSIAEQESSCISCLAGRFDALHNGGRFYQCEKCPAGFFVTSSGSTKCKDCKPGRFGVDDNYCVPCPSGFSQRSAAQPFCAQCEAGQYSDSDGSTECKSCNRGFIQTGLAKAGCLPCNPGTYKASPGAGVCTDTKMGRFAPDINSTIETKCPTGTYQDELAQAGCKVCPVGKYQDTTGEAKCKDCPARKYQDIYRSSSCKSCPAGYRSGGGADRCLECPVGKFSFQAEKLDTCRPCDGGKFRTKKIDPSLSSSEELNQLLEVRGFLGVSSATTEYKRSLLTYALSQEADSPTSFNSPAECDLCPAGYFNAEAAPILLGGRELEGYSFCEPCLPGRAQNEVGKFNCYRCDPNMYSGLPKRNPPLIDNLFRYEHSLTKCHLCPVGRWTGRHGPVTLERHKQNPNFFTSRRRESSTCIQCSAGLVGTLHENGGCEECEPGRYRGYDDVVLLKKGEKTFHSESNVIPLRFAKVTMTEDERLAANQELAIKTEQFTKCLKCPRGWSTATIRKNLSYVDQSDPRATLPPHMQYGSAMCLPCTPGRFNNNEGSPACAFCPIGKYQPKKYGLSCLDCEKGLVPDELRSSCINPQWTVPTDCGLGYFVNDSMRYCKDGDFAKVCPMDLFKKNKLPAYCERPGTIYEEMSVTGDGANLATFIAHNNCTNIDGISTIALIQSTQRNDKEDTYFIDHLWSDINANDRSEIDEAEFMQVVKLAKGIPWKGNFPNGTEISAKLWDEVLTYVDEGGSSVVTSLVVEKWLSDRHELLNLTNIFTTNEKVKFLRKKYHDINNRSSSELACLKMPWKVPYECNPTNYSQEYNWNCVRCDTIPGAECGIYDPRTYLSLLRHKEGYWDVPWKRVPATSDEDAYEVARSRYQPLFVKCPYRGACLLSGCAETTSGALCAVCDEGMFREFETDSFCKVCTSSTTSTRVAIAVSLIAVVSIIFIAFSRQLLMLKRKYEREFLVLMRVLAINLAYVQIATSLPNVIHIEWPEQYTEFLKQFTFVNIDLVGMLGLKCAGGDFWDFRSRIVVLALIPVLYSIAILSRYKCRTYYLKRVDHSSKAWTRIQRKAANYMFELFDRDHSGSIDDVEFKELLGALSGDLEKKRRDEMLMIMKDLGAKFVLQDDGRHRGHMIKVLRLTRIDFMKSAEKNGKMDKLDKGWALQAGLTRIWGDYMQMLLQVLFFVHAPISTRLFHFFNCADVGGRLYLRGDYGMQCFVGKHGGFVGFVIFFLISFTFLFPFSILGYLTFHRKRLYQAHIQQRLGFLYHHFRVGAEMWEIHEVLRKLVLTGMLVFLQDIKFRAFLASVTCLFCFASLNYFKPHPNPIVFKLDQVSFFCTSLKYIYFILLDSNAQENQDLALAATFIMIDVIFCVSSVLTVIHSVRFMHKVDATNQNAGKSVNQGKKTVVHPTRSGLKRQLSVSTSQIVNYGKVESVKAQASRHKDNFTSRLRKKEVAAKTRMQKRLDRRRQKHKKEEILYDYEQVDMFRLLMATFPKGSAPMIKFFGLAQKNPKAKFLEKDFKDLCENVLSNARAEHPYFKNNIPSLCWFYSTKIESGLGSEDTKSWGGKQKGKALTPSEKKSWSSKQPGLLSSELSAWLFHTRNTQHVLEDDSLSKDMALEVQKMKAILSGSITGGKYLEKTIDWAVEHRTRLDKNAFVKLARKVYKKTRLDLDISILDKLWHEISKGDAGISEESIDGVTMKTYFYARKKTSTGKKKKSTGKLKIKMAK